MFLLIQRYDTDYKCYICIVMFLFLFFINEQLKHKNWSSAQDQNHSGLSWDYNAMYIITFMGPHIKLSIMSLLFFSVYCHLTEEVPSPALVDLYFMGRKHISWMSLPLFLLHLATDSHRRWISEWPSWIFWWLYGLKWLWWLCQDNTG